ncbi:MAG: hypothetical protein EXR70_04240 [Deltaproteobacteria bacterium]|nr:hypothetical protein [Deltaproteobacteria bacterium]
MAHAADNSKLGYITIATVHRRQEARLIAAKLEAAKIECLLVDDRDAATGALGTGEIKVQVQRQDVARALPLLRDGGDEVSTSAPIEAKPKHVPRITFALTGWKRTALEVVTLISLAGLLALWLFY